MAMSKKWYTKTPNRLIDDCTLKHSTKKVAFTMLFHVRRNGVIRISILELSVESKCGTATVQQAIRELIAHGYITKEKNYRYSPALGQPVLTKNTYRFNTRGSYTLIPRSILASPVTHSCFAVMLYLYRRAGRTGRAYPSIRNMTDAEQGCGVSKASVCRALLVLKSLGFFIKLFCQRVRGDLSCNSYYLTCMVIKNGRPQSDCEATEEVRPSAHISDLGGLKSDKLPRINKITGISILRRREKGVGQFGKFYKVLGTLRSAWNTVTKRLSTVNIRDLCRESMPFHRRRSTSKEPDSP